MSMIVLACAPAFAALFAVLWIGAREGRRDRPRTMPMSAKDQHAHTDAALERFRESYEQSRVSNPLLKADR